RSAVQQSLAPNGLVGHAEDSLADPALAVDRVVEREPLRAPRPGRDETAARGRVIHEESPDYVMPVPEARFGIIVRKEQQSRVLDAAEGQDEELGLDLERAAGR